MNKKQIQELKAHEEKQLKILSGMNDELKDIMNVIKSMIKDMRDIGDNTILLTQRMDIASRRLDIIEDYLRLKENMGGAG